MVKTQIFHCPDLVQSLVMKPCDSDWDLNSQSFNWYHTPHSQDLMKLSFLMSSQKEFSERQTDR